MAVDATEVVVELAHPPLDVFGTRASDAGVNYVRFRIEEDEVAIGIGAQVKQPGEEMVGRMSELEVCRHRLGIQEDAYERLLGDAMAGDATLFARQDAVEAAWRVVDPILADSRPVITYPKGSWGPPEARALLARGDVWLDPAAKGEQAPSQARRRH
jgi:glucose-6-phosphate 1-dehydrogenase